MSLEREVIQNGYTHVLRDVLLLLAWTETMPTLPGEGSDSRHQASGG